MARPSTATALVRFNAGTPMPNTLTRGGVSTIWNGHFSRTANGWPAETGNARDKACGDVCASRSRNGAFRAVLARGDAVEALMASSQVQVRVPASTSNLGPGFDCLGLAVQLYNTTTLTRAEGAKPAYGMIAETASVFFQRATGGKVAPFNFDVRIAGDIPISRGLGSSVTERLGVLMGLAELVKDSFPITREQILTLLIELEGHPDNAVASFLGGFGVCAHASDDPADGFAYTRVPVK